MRILQLVSRIPYPLKDGGAIHSYNLAMGYAQAGNQVVQLAINTQKHAISPKDLPKEFLKTIDFKSVKLNTNVTILGAFLNLFTDDSYNISRFYDLKVEKVLIKILKKQNIDLVHLDGPFMAPYISAIRKYSKVKIILKAHNVEHLIWQRMASEEKNLFKKPYLKLLSERLLEYETKIVNEVDAVVALSEFDKNVFKKIGCKKPIFISPIGIDLEKYQLKNFVSKQKKAICFIGSLEWMPNLEGLNWFKNEVWKELIQAKPDLKFYIAGRKMPQNIRNWKSKNIIIKGEVSDAQTFMLNHGILIVPLLSGSGMRVKILEAMALGKTIVSTSIGAEGIEIENEKHLLLADEPKAFAKAILKLLNSDEFAKEMAQNAINLVQEKYNNQVLIKELCSFYQTLN